MIQEPPESGQFRLVEADSDEGRLAVKLLYKRKRFASMPMWEVEDVRTGHWFLMEEARLGKVISEMEVIAWASR